MSLTLSHGSSSVPRRGARKIGGPRACEKCTLSKRGCNKALPKCARCTRLNVRCTYDSTILKHTPVRVTRGHVGAVLGKLGPDQDSRHGDSLDSPNDLSSSQINQLLESYKIDWQQAAREYFSTIHSWFSLVHQEKFESTYRLSTDSDRQSESVAGQSSMHDGSESPELQIHSADSALFFLCLYMITQIATTRRPNTEIFCPLYRTTKRIFALLKCLAAPTVELIQCGAFITLFEYGHGDSTSAYRTLSETVALSRVFGLKPGKHCGDTEAAEIDWDEDECRSIWWCLFILDQFIHLYAPTRDLPLLVESPVKDDLFPSISAHDCISDTGLRLPVNTPVSVELSCFQRSAQASVLLREAFIHNAQLKKSGSWTPKTDELDRDIRELLHFMTEQPYSWKLSPNPFALCVGAMFVLYEPFIPLSGTTKADLSRASNETRQAITATTFAVKFLIDGFESEKDLDFEHPKLIAMSPALSVCGFEAMKALMRLHDMFPAAELMCTIVQQAVTRYSQRWLIGEYVLQEVSSTGLMGLGVVV